MKIRAPGKINLALQVLRKRADGFHEIRSLMVTVGLADDVMVEATSNSRIDVSCDSPNVPCGPSNLAYRAAETLKRHTGIKSGCRIQLVKRVPVGAGMGGGSSDAAATMIALNRLWRLGWSRARLAEIAAEIGSDVPFFFWPNCALVRGRGERIEPVRMKWRGFAGLVSSGDHVSTVDVYKRCTPSDKPDNLRTIADGDSVSAFAPLFRNDLEASVFEVAPRVREMRDALIQSGVASEAIRVTGAGSVLFQLFDDRAAAETFVSRAKECPLAANAWVVPIPAHHP
ncbi:MAG: 4-diphosphocytidyl-2-C-methyl-D-erythritol kinase [Phycisphaerae bacterium]|nr:MAG: 4-diphosphocytidyl-2-C-methyl-D-erythritol kinase [Phycisphaerae bacterium]